MYIIFFISVFITFSLSLATFLILLKYDTNFSLTNNIFIFSTALFSALIGGLVAFFASKIQVKANKNNELYKELKLESVGILLAITDLQSIIMKLDNCDENTKSEDLAEFLVLDGLLAFKYKYLYLLDEKDALNYCSILNRLTLLKQSKNNQMDLDKITKLSNHSSQVLKVLIAQQVLLNQLRDNYRL